MRRCRPFISITRLAVGFLLVIATACTHRGGPAAPGPVAVVPPQSLTYPMNPATYTRGQAIASNTPTHTGGDVASYAVSPGLPAGLTLDPATGTLSGTPTVPTVLTTYTITATNAGGSATDSLALAVIDVPPTNLAYGTPAAIYTVGMTIAPNLATHDGGAVTGYSVSPSLPAGLTFNTASGAITGTPSASAALSTHTVTATNSGGSATATVSITVNAAAVAPAFTTHPSSLTIIAGQNAHFTAALSGTPTPTLQWQLSTDNGGTWGDLPGATNTAFDVMGATLPDSGRQFRVVATNGAGNVTSQVATLTVNAAAVAPAFTAQPANQSVTAPTSATFSAAVTGSPTPALQWQRSMDGGGMWLDLAGATASSYSTPATSTSDNGAQFRAVASNSAGTVHSNAGTLTVAASPVGKAWQTAQLIETGDAGDAELPQIAVNAQGDAIAVWQQSDGVSIDIYANRYTAAAGWGTAQRIETDNTGTAQNAQTAIDGGGNAIAVWQQRDVNGNDHIWANRYTVGIGWGAATLIDTAPFDAGNPQIAIDGSGNAIAVWWQSDTKLGLASMVANRYVVGSGWGAAAVIETDSAGHVSAPQIAVDANGNAVAVWALATQSGPYTYTYNVWANHYAVGTGWGSAGPIDSDNTTEANPAPHVAIDANGNALAVWHRPDGTWNSIWANRYTAGSGWGSAVLVETDNTNSAHDARVAIDGNGDGLAVWMQSFGGVANVMANRYTAGNGWGTAVLIETDDAGSAYDVRLVIDSNGNATAVWSQRNVAGYTFNIWANRFTAGTGWGTARMIDNDANPARYPQIGVDANGNLVSVWQQNSGGIRPSIWANTFR